MRSMDREAFKLPLIAGLFLAVHFATWITSLELTTVASSVLLVSTSPVFVAGTAWAFFGERLPARGWAGIAAAMGGTAIIGAGDLTGESLWGDALALTGGAMAAGYVVVGRLARRDLAILPYAVVTYAAAAAVLGVVCILSRVPLSGYPAATWWAIAGLTAGPQLLGHTVINLVLKDIDATTVSVTIMAEPVIATTLAFLFFGEVPSRLVYPGGAAVLLGIYLATSVRRRTPAVVVE